MRINSINNVSFGKVYAVIGTKKQRQFSRKRKNLRDKCNKTLWKQP